MSHYVAFIDSFGFSAYYVILVSPKGSFPPKEFSRTYSSILMRLLQAWLIKKIREYIVVAQVPRVDLTDFQFGYLFGCLFDLLLD